MRRGALIAVTIVFVAVGVGVWEWERSKTKLARMSESEIQLVAQRRAESAIHIFEPGSNLGQFHGPIEEPTTDPKKQRHFEWIDPKDENHVVMGVWVMNDGWAEAHGGYRKR